jgi:hypothetical protein
LGAAEVQRVAKMRSALPRRECHVERSRYKSMRLPISNKVLASDRLPFHCLGPAKAGMQAFTGLRNMRHLFALRRTLLGIGFMAVLVSGFLSVLRATTSERQPPANEPSTGSIPTAAAVPKSPLGDPMVTSSVRPPLNLLSLCKTRRRVEVLFHYRGRGQNGRDFSRSAP